MIRSHYFKPNVEFDFDVSVSNCMLSTDTSKSNSTLGTFNGICIGGFKNRRQNERQKALELATMHANRDAKFFIRP